MLAVNAPNLLRCCHTPACACSEGQNVIQPVGTLNNRPSNSTNCQQMPWLLLLLLQLLRPGAAPFRYCQSQVYVLLGWQGWCTKALLKMRLALETNQRQPRAAVVDQERLITCRLMCYKHLAVKLAVEGQLVGDATHLSALLLLLLSIYPMSAAAAAAASVIPKTSSLSCPPIFPC